MNEPEQSELAIDEPHVALAQVEIEALKAELLEVRRALEYHKRECTCHAFDHEY